jgi:hypothetical protein
VLGADLFQLIREVVDEVLGFEQTALSAILHHFDEYGPIGNPNLVG